MKSVRFDIYTNANENIRKKSFKQIFSNEVMSSGDKWVMNELYSAIRGRVELIDAPVLVAVDRKILAA